MDNREIVKRFGKSGLLSVADELGLSVKSSVNAIDLVDMIDEDLEVNGVPEDMTEIAEDLAFVLGYIDEDGNVIEGEDDDAEDELGSEEVIEEDLPDCFGYADDKDPACKKCKIFSLCMTERIELRPPCFGNMYDGSSPECDNCIEKLDCKEAMEAKNG